MRLGGISIVWGGSDVRDVVLNVVGRADVAEQVGVCIDTSRD